MKKYRVIYNQDCTNLFHITREPISPLHVDKMVDEVADGGADVFLVNPQAQRANYPSKAWQTFWDGYTPGDRSFLGLVTGLQSLESELAVRMAWVDQMKRLADQGCDYLARALTRCRHKGIAPGVTVRMNDMHDAPTPGTHLFSHFYMANPQFHLHNDPISSWSATGLNYEHSEVRNHYLALIRELITVYDFDVLELDFLRFHSYFPRNNFTKHCEIMTQFIKEVRALLKSSRRDISLLARIAATPACAYELGFDVAEWSRNGLVDGISAGAFLNTQWRIAINDFRVLVGEHVALYACTDYTVDRRPGLPVRYLPTDREMLRGFAAGHLAAGADGIELFNFFCPREELYEPVVQEPCFDTLAELGSLWPLSGASKTYTLTSGWSIPETDGPNQVPTALATAETRSFEMLMAAEPDACVEALIVFSGESVSPNDLWLHVNHVPVGPAQSVAIEAGLDCDLREAVFRVPSTALRDGSNQLALRNEGDTITVISIDVRVAPQSA